jgi:hypothetical protein
MTRKTDPESVVRDIKRCDLFSVPCRQGTVRDWNVIFEAA